MICINLSDRRWRLNNLYWIQDAATGKAIRFRPNWAQLDLLQNLHTKNVILKARQLGFTTLIQVLMTDTAVFQRNQHMGVIAHKIPAARDIMRNKVKFSLNHLPPSLRPVRDLDNETTLMLENGSTVFVDTSLRSGTYQILHISEYGDISLNRPDAATEIKTGALNTIAPEAFVFVESTAKGAGGEFHDMCRRAQDVKKCGHRLTKMDYAFHFYPWQGERRYTIDPSAVIIPRERQEYFDDLAGYHGIKLNPGQKAWYHVKAEEQGEQMKREFPSTPDEAFEQSIEGAYYARQMTQARASGKITSVPFTPQLPVHTAWDLGIDDSTAIWFFQSHGREIRLIRYHEEHGEGLPFYAKLLRDLAIKNSWQYGTHLGPHDVEVRDLSTGVSRSDTAQALGLRFATVTRCTDLHLAIEQARQLIPRCVFDAEHCALGIKRLDHYRKAWDDRNGVFKSRPMHNDASHGADAFITLARGLELLIGKTSQDPARRRRGATRGNRTNARAISF